MENLKMQIKLVQTERDRIEILLSEYLNDPIASTGNHAINQRYDAMWNLVKILLQEFDQTNELFLNNNKRKQKAKRIPSLEEETLLEPLILNQSESTNKEMREKLNTLSDEWDLSQIKQHVQY
ncbi:hypothetical protein C1646_778313 [Rhizophagus diaphanus]|nr:hypothetical protein C1646_778313 [Rhizophagus diaphanus] [Rhizophagus sp. MUCL 43196]